VSLDLRTAFFFTALTLLFCAVGMTVVQRTHPGLGTREWTRGLWAMVAAAIILFLRGPGWMLPGLAVAHGLMVFSSVSFYEAIRRFKGKSYPSRLGGLTVFAVPVITTLALLHDANSRGRFLMVAIKGAWDLASAGELLYADRRRPSTAHFFTGAGFLAAGVTEVARGGFGIALNQAAPVTTTVTYLQDLSFFTYHVLVLLGFGFVLMLHERANGELHRLATLDSLTETYNRRTIEELLRKEEARSRRSGASMGVLMVDIDHFKRINDRHGHHAGDDVLRQFVGTVAQCLRAQDSMGRFGGEEFLVVLPETSLKEATGVAERLRAAAAAEVYVSQGLVLRLTVSIGIAMLDAMQATGDDSLVILADRALYEAKGRGRNRVVAPRALPQPATTG
jgi:diguanylate cyclase (GGDEF)-like protein